MTITIPAPKVAEGAPAKARRYLIEGRLTIAVMTADRLLARCQGDGETYTLGFRFKKNAWFCTCPARSDQCAHLRALRLVVDRPA